MKAAKCKLKDLGFLNSYKEYKGGRPVFALNCLMTTDIVENESPLKTPYLQPCAVGLYHWYVVVSEGRIMMWSDAVLSRVRSKIIYRGDKVTVASADTVELTSIKFIPIKRLTTVYDYTNSKIISVKNRTVEIAMTVREGNAAISYSALLFSEDSELFDEFVGTLVSECGLPPGATKRFDWNGDEDLPMYFNYNPVI